MKLVRDPSGRFDKRPFFEDWEIDDECEKMISECLEKRNLPTFKPPLDTDTLSVLLEMHAGTVNLYADLLAQEGPGVEGVTEFKRGAMPRILIDKRLSESKSQNRLRTTMAHELFHARVHRFLWELHWLGQGSTVGCAQANILLASRGDWYEWQAGYGSGAVLVPRSSVEDLFGKPIQLPEDSPDGMRMVAQVSNTFLVSQDAARVRLIQLNHIAKAEAARPR